MPSIICHLNPFTLHHSHFSQINGLAKRHSVPPTHSIAEAISVEQPLQHLDIVTKMTRRRKAPFRTASPSVDKGLQ